MSISTGNSAVKIEPGQILSPDSFPAPNELVCLQVSKVFDQVSFRDCVSRNIVLTPSPGVCRPAFTFEGTGDFDISKVKVISINDSLTKPGYKKIKLFVKLKYKIHYLDGVKHLTKSDEADFNLTINNIYCPDCTAQIGIIRFPKEYPCNETGTLDADGSFIKVEAIAEALNDVISPCTGALILDIGAFFIVKCECNVQLLIPAYGYCPVPPEQNNSSAINCTTFNERTRTPFPSQFFPDQKWNPLDGGNTK